jgi:hypothetical protein
LQLSARGVERLAYRQIDILVRLLGGGLDRSDDPLARHRELDPDTEGLTSLGVPVGSIYHHVAVDDPAVKLFQLVGFSLDVLIEGFG